VGGGTPPVDENLVLSPSAILEKIKQGGTLSGRDIDMPVYPGSLQAKVIFEDGTAFLFTAETIAAGNASVAVQLRRKRETFYPWGCAVEVQFGGAPGAFALDVQVAETDAAANYVTIGSITAVNGTNVGRFDMTNLWPKFLRVNVTTLTNAVTTTVKVSR